MRYKKRNPLYLMSSLIIHIILAFCFWWFSQEEIPKPYVLEGCSFDNIFPISVEIDLIASTRIPITDLSEQFDIPKPDETQTLQVEETEDTHIPPKPKIDLNNDWLTDENDRTDFLTDVERRQQNFNSEHTPTNPDANSSYVVHNAKIPERLKTETITGQYNREIFTLPISSQVKNETSTTGTNRIVLGVDGVLSGVSPNIGAPKINYAGRRGDVFRTTSMGNTWGGSSTSTGSNAGGIYIKMMKEIAHDLTRATTSQKVDIVFVLDETASMVDNIRGIRAYFEYIFEAFKREKRDATYGLVTFTDNTKTYGLTDDLGTFKNWLFKIDVDRGGDISEAGLDALMAAVHQIEFRNDAQRFFIYASDAAFHDADYDGRSPYSLDQVITTLQKEQIRVEVIGLDYLPVKQIAMATGGTWRAIPGKGFLEYVPTLTLTTKMLSKLGTLNVEGGTVGDKITVYTNNPPRPKQLTLTWKVLNPLGVRCYGPFTETKEIPNDYTSEVVLTPTLDAATFQTIPGTYTVIYRLENDLGHKSILRRTFTYE